MSDVRLSNGSPPLERVEARQADNTKPPVCRNLFGSSDPEEVNLVFKEEMLESGRRSMEKYNFDFVRSKPLAPGSFEWQEADAKDEPEFYSRPPHTVKRVDHNGNTSDCQKQRSKRPSQDEPDSARQTKRKKDGDEGNDSQATTEQTPRKSEPST